MPTGNWGSTDLGGTVGLLQASVALRVAWWEVPPGGPGTIVLVQGRAEFMEVYAEAIGDLRARGYAVIAFDLRGQGGSQRRTPRGGHVDRFEDYVSDLAAVVRFANQVGLPRPYHLLGHSLGGLVGLAAAPQLAREIERMVLTAPLLEVAGLPAPAGLLSVVADLGWGVGLSRRLVGEPNKVSPRQFAGNRLTSDPARYEAVGRLVDDNPDLVTGPPTLGWVRSAFRAMRQVRRSAGRPLPIPTLFVASGNDTIVSTPAIDAFARATPGGGLVIIPGARHQVLIEREPLRNGFFAAFDAYLGEAPRRLPDNRQARFARTLRFEPGAPASAPPPRPLRPAPPPPVIEDAEIVHDDEAANTAVPPASAAGPPGKAAAASTGHREADGPAAAVPGEAEPARKGPAEGTVPAAAAEVALQAAAAAGEALEPSRVAGAEDAGGPEEADPEVATGMPRAGAVAAEAIGTGTSDDPATAADRAAPAAGDVAPDASVPAPASGEAQGALTAPVPAASSARPGRAARIRERLQRRAAKARSAVAPVDPAGPLPEGASPAPPPAEGEAARAALAPDEPRGTGADARPSETPAEPAATAPPPSAPTDGAGEADGERQEGAPAASAAEPERTEAGGDGDARADTRSGADEAPTVQPVVPAGPRDLAPARDPAAEAVDSVPDQVESEASRQDGVAADRTAAPAGRHANTAPSGDGAPPSVAEPPSPAQPATDAPRDDDVAGHPGTQAAPAAAGDDEPAAAPPPATGDWRDESPSETARDAEVADGGITPARRAENAIGRDATLAAGIFVEEDYPAFSDGASLDGAEAPAASAGEAVDDGAMHGNGAAHANGAPSAPVSPDGPPEAADGGAGVQERGVLALNPAEAAGKEPRGKKRGRGLRGLFGRG